MFYNHTPLAERVRPSTKGGGSCYRLDQIKALSQVSRDHHLELHLDGARLFNALTATQDDPSQYGPLFDTISICLSKGLGAPVGSLLLGSKVLMKKARRVRKVFGEGMRQAGYLAAAGIFALDNNIDRLQDDHQRARSLGEILNALPFVTTVLPVDTNIVIFELIPDLTSKEVLNKLENFGVKAVPFSKNTIRLVTHLDFTDDMLTEVQSVLKNMKF